MSEICVQVTRDIAAGEELLVWYSDQYLQFMGIPVSIRSSASEPQIEKLDNESKKYSFFYWSLEFSFECVRKAW